MGRMHLALAGRAKTATRKPTMFTRCLVEKEKSETVKLWEQPEGQRSSEEQPTGQRVRKRARRGREKGQGLAKG